MRMRTLAHREGQLVAAKGALLLGEGAQGGVGEEGGKET